MSEKELEQQVEEAKKKKEQGALPDVIKKEISELKKRVNKIKDDRAQTAFIKELDEIEKLHDIFPEDTFLGVIMSVFVETRLPQLENKIAKVLSLEQVPQTRKVPKKNYDEVGEEPARKDFLDFVFNDQYLGGLPQDEREQKKNEWQGLLINKKEALGKILEQRFVQLREKSLKKRQESQIGYSDEITPQEKQTLANFINKLKGKKNEDNILQGLRQTKDGLLDLNLPETMQGLVRIFKQRKGQQPGELLLERLDLIMTGLIDDVSTEKLLLYNDLQEIKAAYDAELPEEIWIIINKAFHRLNEIERQKAEREAQMKRGLPPLASASPEEQQRDLETLTRRAREQQQQMGGFVGGYDPDIGFSSYYITTYDIESIKEDPILYFRRHIARFHLPISNRELVQMRLTEANKYIEIAYDKFCRGGYAIPIFRGLSREEAEQKYQYIRKLYDAYFFGSTAYNMSGYAQNLEQRTRSTELFSPERIGALERHWGFNLFKTIFEQEEVAKAFLRLGDRIDGPFLPSLDSMRKFMNKWLYKLLSNPNDFNNMRAIKALFCFKEGKEDYNEKILEYKKMVNFDKGINDSDFGVIKEEMKLYYDIYDWMGRIAAFDGLYKDKDFWMPKHQGGSPFMPDITKLFVRYGYLEKLKGEERENFIKLLKTATDKDGKLIYEDCLTVSDLKKKIRKQIRTFKAEKKTGKFVDGKPEKVEQAATDDSGREYSSYSDYEIWQKAMHEHFHAYQFNELFRRSGMATSLRGNFGLYNLTIRTLETFPSIAKIFDQHNIAAPWHDFFWKSNIEAEMRAQGRKGNIWLKKGGKGEGRILSFFGGGLKGVNFDKDNILDFSAVEKNLDDPKIIKNLVDAAEIAGLTGPLHEARKMMNTDDWHGQLSMYAGVRGELLKEIISNPIKALMGGKIEDLFKALEGSVYFSQEGAEKATSIWDAVLFKKILKKPLAPSLRHQIRLDMYKEIFRNMNTSFEIKRNIYYYLRRQTFPGVEATASLPARLWGRFKNYVQFERELLYILGPQEILTKRYFAGLFWFLRDMFVVGLKEVMSGTDLEKAGIDPTKL